MLVSSSMFLDHPNASRSKSEVNLRELSDLPDFVTAL